MTNTAKYGIVAGALGVAIFIAEKKRGLADAKGPDRRRKPHSGDSRKEWMVCSLDVWGNENDGWDVNNTFKEGTVKFLTTSDDNINETDSQIVEKLRKHGWLKKGLKASSVTIDGSDGIITINSSKDDYPLYELRLKDY